MKKPTGFSEIDFELVETIMNTPLKGMYFKDLLTIRPNPVSLRWYLRKLTKGNFLTKQILFEGDFYCITPRNQPLNLMKVVCPVCKTIARTINFEQRSIRCVNPECKWACGSRRKFMLINYDHLKFGQIKKINRVV